MENKDKDQGVDVRQRILESAESLFAEKGFDKTSVRDITKKADCNVASVNYYFSGKKNLHVEVYRQHLAMLREVRIDGVNEVMTAKAGEVTLEELIRAFVVAFFKPLSNDPDGHNRMMLMWREMIEPHLPENIFFEEVIQPISEVFVNAIEKVCPELGKEQVLFSIGSIVGQLVHVVMSMHFFPGCKGKFYDGFDFDAFIEHVVTFSTAGIKELAKKGTADAAK